MSRYRHKAVPAVRLPDGEILKGEPITVLAMRAIGDGVSEGITSGFINHQGHFKSIYPKPEEIIPFMVSSKEYAQQLLRRCSYTFYEAANALVSAGREDAENLKLLVDGFEKYAGVPMTSAIKGSFTKEVFYGGYTHGEVVAQHPNFGNLDGDKYGYMQPYRTGFVILTTMEFVGRREASKIIRGWTGYSTSKKMISGEEFVPKLSSHEDAVNFAENMHPHGYNHVKLRIARLSRSKVLSDRDREYLELLKTAMRLRDDNAKFKR